MWTPGVAVLATTTVGGYSSVSGIMITALHLHVRRLLQHGGPHIQFSKPCYQLRVYIWSPVNTLPMCTKEVSCAHAGCRNMAQSIFCG
jgi:hypothetical protein